jgi:hypothetical protein
LPYRTRTELHRARAKRLRLAGTQQTGKAGERDAHFERSFASMRDEQPEDCFAPDEQGIKWRSRSLFAVTSFYAD